MKNTKLFQYVFIGAFIFFIIVGAILFSTYKSTDKSVTNISISMWGTVPSDAFNSFVNSFFSENEIKYNISYTEKNLATFDKELVEALASGVGPDAIILPEDLIVRYTNKIYPIPYTTLPELTFKQTFVQEGELYLNNNGVLALPFTVDPMVMYWNRDFFNNAGVTKAPATWAEIISLVPKMTKKDQNNNIFSSTVALGEFRNVVNAKDILAALFIQAGSPIVSYDLSGYFESALKSGSDSNTAPVELALSFFTSFSNPSKPTYSWNRSLTDSLSAFVNGDLAMYFGFASEYISIKNKNPNLNFDIALLPQVAGAKIYNTMGHMLGFAIMRNSANPAGAYIVLTTLTSSSAYPFWKDIFNIPSARRDILGLTETNAVKTVFNKSAIMSKGWLDPNKSSTSAIFQEMVESYTTGRESLESVVSTASDRLDNLLK
jgi:ABC-type glycerol-3-phosphate transport system substrate-binding protein